MGAGAVRQRMGVWILWLLLGTRKWVSGSSWLRLATGDWVSGSSGSSWLLRGRWRTRLVGVWVPQRDLLGLVDHAHAARPSSHRI